MLLHCSHMRAQWVLHACVGMCRTSSDLGACSLLCVFKSSAICAMCMHRLLARDSIHASGVMNPALYGLSHRVHLVGGKPAPAPVQSSLSKGRGQAPIPPPHKRITYPFPMLTILHVLLRGGPSIHAGL